MEEAAAARAPRGKRPATGERKGSSAHGRQGAPPRAPADGTTGSPNGRHARRGSGHHHGGGGDDEARAARKEARKQERLDRRVAEALESDRSALERRREVRKLNRRVERAMRPPADLEAVVEQDLEARLRAVGVS